MKSRAIKGYTIAVRYLVSSRIITPYYEKLS